MAAKLGSWAATPTPIKVHYKAAPLPFGSAVVPLGTLIGVKSERRRRLALIGNLMHWWDFKFVHANECIRHFHLIGEVELPVLLSVATVWTISRLWSFLSLSAVACSLFSTAGPVHRLHCILSSREQRSSDPLSHYGASSAIQTCFFIRPPCVQIWSCQSAR